MTMLESIISSLDSKFADLKLIREKRSSRIMASYSSANDNLPPNKDRSGRLHAPCDGYEDIDGKGIYGKGEFLPIPECVREEMEREGIHPKNENKTYGSSSRLLIEDKDAFNLLSFFTEAYGLKASTGKRFQRSDVPVCYLYLSGNESMIKAIETAISDFKAKEREASKLLKGLAPEGKAELKVTIKFIKTIKGNTQWGEPDTYKMMCETEDKATVWGTLPKALHGSSAGTTFTLRGIFKRADGDNTHSFVSRPTAKTI